MIDWQQMKLIDVADIKLSNVDKKTKLNERTVRLCNYTDIYKNSFINSDLVDEFMVASCSENEYEKFILKKGQVAITKDSEKRDDIGIPSYIEEDLQNVVLGYHLALITPDSNKLDGRFLNYWLNTKQSKRYFENNAGGSGQRCTLVLDIIKSIPVSIPKLIEQKLITKVLSDLEAKIEVNNKINQQLEAMAKTLYDYWFVQFDFPDKNGKPYKSAGGKMVYNEELKRDIPEGWEVKKLGDACRIVRGASPRPIKDYIRDEGLPWIKISDATKSDCRFILETKQFIKKAGESKTRVLEPGALILSNSASPAIPRIVQLKSGIHDGWLLIENFKHNLTKEFLYQYFLTERARILNFGTGSIFKNLKTDYIKDLNIVIPKSEILAANLKKVTDINSKLLNSYNQNQKLTELRDWLLPMLMNGQVTVKSHEAGVENEGLGMVAEGGGKYEKN